MTTLARLKRDGEKTAFELESFREVDGELTLAKQQPLAIEIAAWFQEYYPGVPYRFELSHHFEENPLAEATRAEYEDFIVEMGYRISASGAIYPSDRVKYLMMRAKMQSIHIVHLNVWHKGLPPFASAELRLRFG